jgi:hypothetical protein
MIENVRNNQTYQIQKTIGINIINNNLNRKSFVLNGFIIEWHRVEILLNKKQMIVYLIAKTNITEIEIINLTIRISQNDLFSVIFVSMMRIYTILWYHQELIVN